MTQLEFPAPLVAPGERLEVGYDTRKVSGVSGFVYVRNDAQRAFIRVALQRRRASQQLAPSDALRVLRATVPGFVVRGRKLFYYAVLRPAKGRSLRIPARSTAPMKSALRCSTEQTGSFARGGSRAGR